MVRVSLVLLWLALREAATGGIVRPFSIWY